MDKPAMQKLGCECGSRYFVTLLLCPSYEVLSCPNGTLPMSCAVLLLLLLLLLFLLLSSIDDIVYSMCVVKSG